MKVILRLQTNTITSEISIEANTSITIGRSDKADFKIPDELVSSTHLKVTLSPPKLEITDLESKNGTYLNGLRVEHSDVFIGDEIRIGSTKITILSEKMDQNSINFLTFPGMANDRMAHGLQLDFTGARSLNQSGHHSERKPTASSNKELEVRKKAQSKIKLSKQEIKLRHKRQASLASTIDTILTVMSIALPLFLLYTFILINPKAFEEERMLVMFGSVLGSVSLFSLINYKVLKFTLGEKFSGIQKAYESQN